MIYNEEAKLWIPDDSVKTDRCWRFITRNVKDLDAGIEWTKKRSVALQAGGHIGIFPNYLAGHFTSVITYEPDPDLYECLSNNARPRVFHCQAALGVESGFGKFRRAVGGTGALDPRSDFDVGVVAFDDASTDVNFIHLDVEGGEVEALIGMRSMIERCSPTLQLEILPRFKDEIYAYVESIGYRVANDTRRDHVFVRDAK
jgi:FkbM family methyltransferase